MPESFTCHQCHRPQRIGRRSWMKYQPVYSEGPPWAGRGVCQCVSIPTGECDCKGFGMCMCGDYVVWGCVTDATTQTEKGVTVILLVHSDVFVCPQRKREGFFHLHKNKLGMLAMNNNPDVRCTTEDVLFYFTAAVADTQVTTEVKHVAQVYDCLDLILEFKK